MGKVGLILWLCMICFMTGFFVCYVAKVQKGCEHSEMHRKALEISAKSCTEISKKDFKKFLKKSYFCLKFNNEGTFALARKFKSEFKLENT